MINNKHDPCDPPDPLDPVDSVNSAPMELSPARCRHCGLRPAISKKVLFKREGDLVWDCPARAAAECSPLS